MKFRTELKLDKQIDEINYQSKIVSIGSCFADSIGNKLSLLDFDVVSNPFGVLFNPYAIKNALQGEINEEHFIHRDNNFYHLDYHSELFANTEAGLIIKLIKQFDLANQQLKNSDYLIITFGTAWAYTYTKTKKVIANCQKVPQVNFTKELLNLETLQLIYESFFSNLFNANNKLKIILTVSPVRHIKDGLHENNLSKSTLLLLAEFLKNRFDNVRYFPAYELIVDDLRDYRFYKEDMIHPNEQAIQYVFTKFADCYFTEKTKKAVAVKESILKLSSHRTSNAGVEQSAIAIQLEELEKEFKSLK